MTNKPYSFAEYREFLEKVTPFSTRLEFGDTKYALLVVNTPEGGKPFIPRGRSGVVLWEECDYCGTKAWPKEALFDYWVCTMCGGLVR